MGEIFSKAKQIFIKGMEEKPNTFAYFSKTFDAGDNEEAVTLLISAHVFYRAYVNGRFVSHGPAPAPYGYLRVDRIDISPFVKQGENRLAVEVMGYVPKENNYATLETSCLCAEIRQGGRILAATDCTWEGAVSKEKVIQTETLSFGRRVPQEWYRLQEGYDGWRREGISGGAGCRESGRPCRFLERGVPLPEFRIDDRPVFTMVSSLEKAAYDGPQKDWWESEIYYETIGTESPARPSAECAALKDTVYDGEINIADNYDRQGLITLKKYKAKAGLDFSFDEAETGFLGMEFETAGPVTIDILFNDYLTDEGCVPAKADSVNRVIRVRSQGGTCSFEAFEAHYLKYVKLIVDKGECFKLKKLYLRSYRHPDQYRAGFCCEDDLLNRIYQSSKKTLLTNSLGFFMDSPERERAGWAGDSYWTGRAAQVLLSDVQIERTMLEDFLLAEPGKMMDHSFPSCCCGGARQEELMMPTWNMFVLLELTDYYKRTKDEELKDRYQYRVYGWFKAAAKYENELGLLENLPGSMFLDWSASNKEDYNSPVSTAANAFYAFLLKRAGEMYGEAAYIEKSERICSVLRKSYEGLVQTKHEVFTMYPYMADSMYVEGGELREKDYYSEAAQYYYFRSGLLNRKLAPDLARCLLNQLGPRPSKMRGTAHLSVGNAGIFFGYMLRFEVLSQLGEYEQLKKDISYLGNYMISRDPHTFWETLSGEDSRNHGFGAHFGVVLVRDFLGIEIPDRIGKTVKISPHPCGLKWAKGGYRTLDGPVQVQWHQNSSGFYMIITVPQNYQAEITLPAEWMYAKRMLINGKGSNLERHFLVDGNASISILADQEQ